jgi:Terminase small subunit
MATATAKAGAGKARAKPKPKPKPPTKKTARKAAKKAAKKKAATKRAPRKPPKTPARAANHLATIKQAYPGITSEEVVALYNMPPEEVLKRRAFVHEYVKDFSERNAAMRMGYPEETALSTGKILLYHAFTQLKVSEILDRAEAQDVVSSARVVAALWREANAPDVPFSSNSATRIAALKELAKIKKLTGPASGGVTPANSGFGGVMIVPAYVSPADWEEHARKTQTELKEAVCIDV